MLETTEVIWIVIIIGVQLIIYLLTSSSNVNLTSVFFLPIIHQGKHNPIPW